MATSKVKYALQTGEDREGEFTFCCSTQTHFVDSLEAARSERDSKIQERIHAYDPPLSRKEALEELGGITIYKVTLEKVK